jgi:hypothetical protein
MTIKLRGLVLLALLLMAAATAWPLSGSALSR